MAQEEDDQSEVASSPENSSQAEPVPTEPVPTPPLPEYPLMKNLFALTLGAAYWPSLDNKTLTAASSHPKLSSFGIALSGAYHRHVVHWPAVDLYLGAEIGLFNFDNTSESTPSNQPITGDLDGRVWYVGPSFKFMMAKRPFTYYVGGGGGYYEVSITESNELPRSACTRLGPCFNTVNSLHRSTFGGFVSLGAELILFMTQSGSQWRLRLEDQIHIVNFGSIESFAPGAGNLSGPINVLQIGLVLGF